MSVIPFGQAETYSVYFSAGDDTVAEAEVEFWFRPNSDGVLADVRINGRSIGLEAGQILLDAVTGRNRVRQRSR
jgi:hypothetical protein